MNRLLENGQIIEFNCGSNFAYILNDANLFFSTEYKVMQNQSSSCFIKCMKMLYNGKLQLFYLISSLKPFSSLVPTLDPEGLTTIVANLFTNIIDVKYNGFLSCQNIDIAFDKIYVDPSTLKVSLVYIPVTSRIHSDELSFENEVRTSLVKLITGNPSLTTTKTMQLVSDLSNGLLSLEDIHTHLKGGVVHPAPKTPVSNGSAARLVSMDSANRAEIAISKDSFLVGKNASSVDGAVTFNKMISRIHCRIDNKAGQYTVTDLQSANGTFVNRVRLQANRPQAIKNGDIIRLANSDFQFITN